MKKNNRSQVTIFIIIALVIVVAIVLIFTLINNSKNKTEIVNAAENPQLYIKQCVEQRIQIINDNLIENNFYPNIDSNYFVYYGKKIPFLCKSSQFYAPCINQEPGLINSIKNKIEQQTKVSECFDKAITLIKNDGYSVNEEKLQTIIMLDSDGISVTMNKKIIIKNIETEEVRNYEKFNAKILSPIYSLADSAIKITNYESTLCSFNSASWMKAYPNIAIKEFRASDGTRVYTLVDVETEKEIKFAVSSCILPAGL